MTSNKTFLSVALGAALIVVSGAAMSASGVNIHGKAYNSGGPIASTAHLSSVESNLSRQLSQAEQNIIKSIIEVGQQVSTAIANDGQGQNAQTRMQTQMLEDAIKSQARAQEVSAIEDRYSVENLGYQTCSGVTQARTSRIAGQRAARSSKSTQDTLYNHNLSGKKVSASQAEFRARIEETTEGVELVYAAQKTLTGDEWEKGKEYLKNTINPIPDPMLPDEIPQDTELSKRYNLMVNYKAQELSLPERVLSDIHAFEEPVIPADSADVVQMWAAVYPDRPTIDIANSEGNISKRLYQDLQVRSRIDNPEWDTSIKGMGEKGVLVEIAKMQALALDLQNQQLDLSRKLAMLEARREVASIQGNLNGQIKQLYNSSLRSGVTDTVQGN